MRFVYLGPPDEPDVGTTFAFGVDWYVGAPQPAPDGEAEARIARHPHWAAEGDDARVVVAAVVETLPQRNAKPVHDGEAEAWLAENSDDVPDVDEAVKRKPGRPRKVAD